MIVRVPRSVRLTEIVGVSPLNPRHQIDDADLDGLADSILAIGMTEPILVERSAAEYPSEDEGDTPAPPSGAHGAGYLCLDGSRRWRALQRLAEHGRIQADAKIGVVEIVASEADKREIALAVNFHRLGLHPVEQYEAFAGMARHRTTAEIAAHFRLDQKDVIKALALGRDIAPQIRAAWKADEITADAAKAYTVTRDLTKQLDVFTSLAGEARNDAAQIRRLLRGDAVIARHSLAIFARADYLAAGGAISEDLFEEQSFFEDGPLLREIAESKLRAIAERIRADQGWKWCATQFDETGGILKVADCDMTAKDEARLEEIETLVLAGCDDAAREKLMREADEIELRAWTRGVPPARRAELGFILALDQDGKVEIDGGFLREADRAPASASEGAETQDDEGGLRRSPEPAAETRPGASVNIDEKRQLRALKDAALARAIGDCAAGNVNLALSLFLAAMHCHGFQITSLSGGVAHVSGRAPNDLIDEIAGLPFADALARCVDAPLCDLTAAFAATIARSISGAAFDPDDMGKAVRAIGQVSAIRPALDRAFDRKAWFDAAPKQAALAAISEIQGMPCGNLEGGRKAIADYAADLASREKWLPAPWSAWLADMPDPIAEPAGLVTLAEAMALAFEADADGQAVARFLDRRTRRGAGLRVRATELHDAFLAWSIAEGVASPPALGAFGTIVKRLGVTRWRHKTGIFYLDLALEPTDARESVAAE